MKKVILLLSIFSLIFLWGCGAPVRIFSDVDDSGQFAQYTTYSFVDFSEGNQKTIPGMELERIRVAFARELENRGLTFMEKGGDVAVKITVYHREALDNHYYRSWRYRSMERAIAVDMYDNHTRKHIWHCAAVGELEYNSTAREEGIPEVAAEIFERYPVPALTDI